MKNQREYELQTAVCDYLRSQYPNVFFMSDTVAQIQLTMPQAKRNKRVQHPDFKCPDLLILEPRTINGCRFSGLFIELKIESPYKRNGEIKASQNDHLLKQWQTIERLKKLGYFATILWNFEMVKKQIDWYLK